jgi:hypothetical protein
VQPAKIPSRLTPLVVMTLPSVVKMVSSTMIAEQTLLLLHAQMDT